MKYEKLALDQKLNQFIEDALEEKTRRHYHDLWNPSPMSDDAIQFALGIDRENLEEKMGYSHVVHGISFKEPEKMICFRSEKSWADTCRKSEGARENKGLVYQLRSIFAQITSAINNTGDYNDRSFSKSLVIALFKYGSSDSTLVVKELNLNTISLLVTLDCPNWFGAGNERSDQCGVPIRQRHREQITVDLSLNSINKKKIEDAVWRGISPEFTKRFIECGIDIDINVHSFTVDVSELKKEQVNDISNSYEQIAFRRSYRKDREVISDRAVLPEEVFGKSVTEYVRILALLKIFMLETEYSKFKAYYSSDASRGSFEHRAHEDKLLEVIWGYMDTNCPAMRDHYSELVRSVNCNGAKLYPQYQEVPNDPSDFSKSKSKAVLIRVLDQLFAKRVILSNEDMYRYARGLLTSTAKA